jgi:phenylpropionate dioxygenase-like ring-hydroxylating dioxygenase large terminal subunit
MNLQILRYFHPVVETKELGSHPRRVEIAGHACVLFRDSNDKVAALDDQCPHRRAPLSQGWVRPDGRIACGYHGWHFDARGNGQSPSCPELKHCDTISYQVIDRFGFLWLATRSTPLSEFPTMDVADFEFVGTISTLFHSSMELTLDNITEDEHFAYIHSTFGWNAAHASEVFVETRNCADHTEVQYLGPQRSSFLAPLGGVLAGDIFHNEWSTYFEPVHTVYTFGWRDGQSGRDRPVLTRAIVFLVPETAGTTRAQMMIFMKIAPSAQALFRSLFHRLAIRIARTELNRDAAFMVHVASAPSTLQGMRLTRFDKALIHNRDLLRSIYWQETEQVPRPTVARQDCDRASKVTSTRTGK